MGAVESKIKHIKVGSIKPPVPVAKAINRDFGHHDLLHSLHACGIWTLLSLPLAVIFGWLPVVTLALSYSSHLVGDACTHTGVLLFHPNKRQCYLLPSLFRIEAGAVFEEIIFAVFACLIFALLANGIFLFP